MSPSLSKELILEIISRLPPRNAMQLCCMSKDWHSALSSSLFRSLHFDNFTRKTRSSTYFWRHRHGHYMIDAFFIVRNCEPTFLLLCPNQCSDSFHIVGIINGVVCLADGNIVNGNTFFWNPIIKRKISIFQNIEAPVFAQTHDRSLGFAYNEATSEYKLFSAFNQEGLPTLGHVLFQMFSFTTGDWTNLPDPEDFLYAIANSSPAAFFKGFCHWPVYGRGQYDVRTKPYVLRVHACDYSYSVFALPDGGVPIRMIRNTRVVSIEGSLGLIPCPSPSLPVHDSCMRVWIMREYGDCSSWIKRYRIEGEVSIIRDELTIFRSGLVSNPRNQSRRVLGVKICDADSYIQGFSESLELLYEGRSCVCFCPN